MNIQNQDNPVGVYSFLAAFGRLSESKRQKGEYFERLTREWLRSVEPHKGRFQKIWLWREFAEINSIDRTDLGIDLVALTLDEEYCAIQCKFFHPNHKLDKKGIDSFISESGKVIGSVRFSERLIVATGMWGDNAEKAIQNQRIPCTRLDFVTELESAKIDWQKVSEVLPLYPPTDGEMLPRGIEFDQTSVPADEIKGGEEVDFSKLLRTLIPARGFAPKNKLRKHQKDALNDVVAGFENADRGKLIMACGTGKTFTALKIAEKMVADGGNILFLVPSLALLSQSLQEWSDQSVRPLRNFAVCSDTKVGESTEDISVHDLAIPATTDSDKLAEKLRNMQKTIDGSNRTSIVFATYHSIQVVADAQKSGAPTFDLIICDEAHRTTGAEDPSKEVSPFVKVHDSEFLRAKKRLYMTATPRVYANTAKTRANEAGVKVFSMDDAAEYGEELHRLDFSAAVGKGLLSDYKVLILTVNQDYVNAAMESSFAGGGELGLDDTTKIIGCWNGLAKKISNREEGGITDSAPMRRAVAFTQTIKASKEIAGMFSGIVDEYIARSDEEEGLLKCEVRHVDGTQNALVRNRELQWLKSEPRGNACHILSNVRCLSEGVDVPALDAVMFLNPRRSQVDIVQSVGRVMRKAQGKDYGYIILPVGVSADEDPDVALDNNDNYRVVWDVLQALRAHDNRFNAEINKIELNKKASERIDVIGVGLGDDDDASDSIPSTDEVMKQASLLDSWREAIYAKMVIKCGDRRYWETWAQDIAKIAEEIAKRIEELLASGRGESRQLFDEFYDGLKANINPSIDESQAVEMLAQHWITKPVFDALFEGYDFAAQNPVSKTMEAMLELLEEQGLGSDSEVLAKFYDSVHERAEGIDNAEGKQKIIIELYEKFFITAFPKMAERLGIVYTPMEVVDFILKSVDDAMQSEFGKGLSDENVDILDPFTGTGTFIVRMLQGGYIKPGDLQRKYRTEIHANEIVLLAYYIAAVNIEEAYHFLAQSDYEPFPGILLTDTFQMGEKKGGTQNMFPENFERGEKQNQRDIRVIVGNPPYSAKQRNENDDNKNIEYPNLDERIARTYANKEYSNATNHTNLYDSYIRSIRWASDRIGSEGIIGFVSNNSYIDAISTDGMRKIIYDEFSKVYCFNLRGNQRTQGRASKMEGGKIFGSGSRAGIAITLFIKNRSDKNDKCNILYHDIGDFITREQKLEKIKNLGSVNSMEWQKITPNSAHDWINQRHPEFEKFLAMGRKENKRNLDSVPSAFTLYSRGVITCRDSWAYNFSREKLAKNMEAMIDFYNHEVARCKREKPSNIDQFVNNDPTKISWDSTLKGEVEKSQKGVYSESNIRRGIYRPFTMQWIYFDRKFSGGVHRMFDFFPNRDAENLAICVSGKGGSNSFSALMVKILPDLNVLDAGSQCFPLYSYANLEKGECFDKQGNGRMDNIPDSTLTLFRKHYENEKISKLDIFYYVYGLLHSPQYKTKYAVDLKKMLPRIPMHKEFRAFSKAGKTLGDLHVNYETAEEYPLSETKPDLTSGSNRKVVKMKFAKNGKETDKTAIVYNNDLVLREIPLDAYKYVVNGKSAIEWIIDRYQVKTDKASQITNDPNDWSDDPNYIISLLKKVVYVSVESVKIIESLPDLEQ